MENKEVLKHIESSFKELGCIKAQKKSWVLEMPEIAIVLKARTSSWSKDFYIDLGIIFKRLYPNKELKTTNIDECHIGHELVSILQLQFKEGQGDVEKLFSYGPPETEVLGNISTLIGLIRNKVVPYFDKFNDYKYLSDNFEKNIAFKPFFVYFELPEFYVDFFKKQLKA